MIYRVLYSLILLLYLPSVVASQKEGDSWVLGYNGQGSERFSIMFVDFKSAELNVTLHYDYNMSILESASNVCNDEGDPLIWTNGMELVGVNDQSISDTVAYDGKFGYWIYYYDDVYGQPGGFPKHDGAIILPVPNVDNEYSVLYHSADVHPDVYFAINEILEARVRVNDDNTYTLLYQDSLIGQHEWYTDRIEAVKHANGRDWWIVLFESDSPTYYCYLLTSAGIELSHSSETNLNVKYGLGQACFSPYGNYFARMDAITLDEGQYLSLYSFDRCTGIFELLEQFHTSAGFFTGTSFSPSERYLYGNNNDTLWRWDVQAEDIPSSKAVVGVYDGFIEPGWFGTYFGTQVLAPDGRIYMITPNGSSNFLHVIEQPDLSIEVCKFLQHSIDLTVANGRTAPNLPNFRLGPLDGSPCDTLGIDNIPVARWRYEEDEPGWYHDIRFTDLSFYDPQTWFWDFGDGETSDEPSPVHSFEDGLYHVCLTVSNANGTDSTCQWIEILPTGTHDASDSDTDLSIRPNPFDTELHIESKSGVFRTASFHLFDMYGRLILHQPEIPIPLKISLPSLPSGMYLCRIEEADGTSYSFKVMKQ